MLPGIFLAVAAFILNVVLARQVATQRPQIAALKALGYRNTEIAGHYMLLAVAIAAAGIVLGLVGSHWLGRGMVWMYTEVFRVDALAYRMVPGVAVGATLAVAAAAALGALAAIRAVVRLSPAQAMLPPAPPVYRRTLLERLAAATARASGHARRLAPAALMVLRNLERRPLRAAVTVGGIASAIAIVIMGTFFRDAMEVIVDASFNLGMRGDIVVWTVEPVDAGAARSLARIPGVTQVEPGRRVEVRFVNGQRSEVGLVQGRAAPPELQRIIDIRGRSVALPHDGLLMGERLARKLDLRTGDLVTIELREGRRYVRQVAIEQTLRDMMGLNAYMDRRSLNRLIGEGDLASDFTLAVERGSVHRVLQATQQIRAVAGAFSKASMVRNMEEVTSRNILVISGILSAFAAVIAVGVVYNNARIALAERTWELASLRVLGFTRGEVSMLLLGELALGIAIALPLGMALGWALTHWIVILMDTDQFSFPVVIRARTYAWAALCVLAAGVLSALVVRRRIDRLDMVAALKTRE